MIDKNTKQYQVIAGQTDIHKKLKLSALFANIQSLTHLQPTSSNASYTPIVLKQEIYIKRIPTYATTYTLTVYPHHQQHLLFPFHFSVYQNEEEIMYGTSWWVLIDPTTRKVVFPESVNVALVADTHAKPMRPIETVKSGKVYTYAADYAMCDMNGHINNAKYFDLMMQIDTREKSYIAIEYVKEIPFRETFQIISKDNQMTGYLQEECAFRILSRDSVDKVISK